MALHISYYCLSCGRSVTKVFNGDQREFCYWCYRDGKKPRYVLKKGKWKLKYFREYKLNADQSDYNSSTSRVTEEPLTIDKVIRNCARCDSPVVCERTYSSKIMCLKCTGATGNANAQDNRR